MNLLILIFRKIFILFMTISCFFFFFFRKILIPFRSLFAIALCFFSIKNNTKKSIYQKDFKKCYKTACLIVFFLHFKVSIYGEKFNHFRRSHLISSYRRHISKLFLKKDTITIFQSILYQIFH